MDTTSKPQAGDSSTAEQVAQSAPPPEDPAATGTHSSEREQQSPAKVSADSDEMAAGKSALGGENSPTDSSRGASSAASLGDKAETEDDDLLEEEEDEDADTPCECVQCEVCMAENWWRMAAYHNSLLQQQEGGEGIAAGASSALNDVVYDANSATAGLDLIGSAATLMLSQQQGGASGGSDSPPDQEDMLQVDFSMPKLREFFESQKASGIPNFPEDFDEFWLLVVKARLFNIFKYRGPEAYNRIVLKIRDIARHFRKQVEERERYETLVKEAVEKGIKPPTTPERPRKPKKSSG